MAANDWATSGAGIAASYGWSTAVINSNPELKSLFGQATQQNWTADEFVARVRDTQWFKTNQDTARQTAILRVADPATYKARLGTAVASATAISNSIGAQMSPATALQIGREAVMFGWSPEQIKQHLVNAVQAGAGGLYSGAAGTEQSQYNALAQEYGVALSSGQMASFIRGSVMGGVNQQTVQNWMIQQASSRYPALADRLKSGETLKQIADPYVQSQAKIWETNPNAISITDPSIQTALSSKDATGKPAVMSVWQYEQQLRQDPRFLKTQGAQDQGMQMAHSVLKDMGLQS